MMKEIKKCWLWRISGGLWMLSSVAIAADGDWSMVAMYLSVGAMNLAVGQMYA